MRSRMVWMLILALALSAIPLTADAPNNAIDEVAIAVQLTAGQDWTSPHKIKLESTSFQAMDWHILPASGNPSINVIVLQSNNIDGPFNSWSSALDSSTVVNNVTITSTFGGTPWRLTPGSWAQYRFINSAAATATITVRSFAR